VLAIGRRFVTRGSKFYFPYEAILRNQNNISPQSLHELSHLFFGMTLAAESTSH